MADSIILVPWNDIDVLRRTVDEHAGEIAAIITEAIMCNSNVIFPKAGYLEGVRSLCDERGIVLIFDEVITGFRVSLGGAQELLGVTPDIATFAKAMAGGFPVSMIAGRREIMSQLEDSTVWHGGTANGNFQAMYAVEAELQELMADDGAVYKQLYATSNRLMEGLRALAQKHEQPLLIQGPGPTFHITFTEADEITDYRSHARAVDEEKYSSFRAAMLERGVRLNVGGQWYVSTAQLRGGHRGDARRGRRGDGFSLGFLVGRGHDRVAWRRGDSPLQVSLDALPAGEERVRQGPAHALHLGRLSSDEQYGDMARRLPLPEGGGHLPAVRGQTAEIDDEGVGQLVEQALEAGRDRHPVVDPISDPPQPIPSLRRLGLVPVNQANAAPRTLHDESIVPSPARIFKKVSHSVTLCLFRSWGRVMGETVSGQA